MNDLTLNIGCGSDTSGDIRMDLYRTSAAQMRADIEDGIPFRNDTFNEVFSRSLLEHIRNPHAALVEMVRVCRPGGTVRIITDNAGCMIFHTGFLGVPAYHQGGYKSGAGESDRHYVLFTEDHLRNHFKAAGLNVISVDYGLFEKTGWITMKIWLGIARLFSRTRLRHVLWPRIQIVGNRP